MIWTTPRRAAAALMLTLSLTGCGLLDVSDPTAIQSSELENAEGANLLRLDALKQLNTMFGNQVMRTGYLSDELFADTSPLFALYGIINYDEYLDRRKSVEYESMADSYYDPILAVRTAATVAMPGLRTYSVPEHVGEMFVVRGLTTVLMAEQYCPGFPLHEVVNSQPVYGGPLTTDQVFERAVADFDSAIALTADSARILNLARIGRARALLGLGRYAEAGQAAAPVPLLYVKYGEFTTSQPNELARQPYTDGFSANTSVANSEGGNGLDFVSANDPRVKTTPRTLAYDNVTRLYTADKYPGFDADIPLASGIEARLIEAEAALQAGDFTTWLDRLNEPRRNAWSTIVPAVSGPLTDLTDPGTPEARVDLTFRERAFWLWGTGHRLGDLRRLIARYNRAAADVFPTGAYRMGGQYDIGTAMPFKASSESGVSPSVTGCTAR